MTRIQLEGKRIAVPENYLQPHTLKNPVVGGGEFQPRSLYTELLCNRIFRNQIGFILKGEREPNERRYQR